MRSKKPRKKGRRRTIVWLLVVAGLALAVALSSSPTGLADTTALRLFLEKSGFDVRDGNTPPVGGGTFVVLADLRDEREAQPLLNWARSGGRLVIASPGSATAFGADIERTEPIGVLGTTHLSPNCVADVTQGVGNIVVRAPDQVLDSIRPRSVWCYPHGNGAFLIETPLGSGSLVAMGGYSPFTDQLLREGDNAALALRVFGGGGPIVFGSALPPAAQHRGLWATVPSFVKVLIFEIIIAMIMFAFVRGRRLGRPVIEEPVESIPAGELVVATGGLFRRARATGYSARLIRERAKTSLARRTGLAQDSPRFAASVAAAAGMPEDRVERALGGPEPANDTELLVLAKELDEITHQLEGART
jgi:hypothetical protein